MPFKFHKYPINKDFWISHFFELALPEKALPAINRFLSVIYSWEKPPEGLSSSNVMIHGYHNSLLSVDVFEPKDVSEDMPCLVYFHGGAFILGGAPSQKRAVCHYALKTPCRAVYVHYRLAPQYPFPYAPEDCYAALCWVHENVQKLHIDPNRIAVGGDSAGGALAASVCIMARERKGPNICYQFLLYPVLDARQETESMKNFTDTPMWNAKLNHVMWRYYLRDGFPEKREYASPAEADSFTNMPSAYVETTEFDCLRDEGKNYASALREAGVAVESYQAPGSVHGYDIFYKSSLVQKSWNVRVQNLKKAFWG